MTRTLLVLIVAAVISLRADADESLCRIGETPENCFARIGEAWAQAEVAKTNTGIANLASPSQSTTTDFLSMLTAALIVPVDGNSSPPLAIDFNVPMVFTNTHLKLQAVLATPELSADVTQRLAANAEGMTVVKDSLSVVDDVTLSGTVDRSTRRLGRSIAPHRDAYMKMLRGKFLQGRDPNAMGEASESVAASEMIGNFGEKFAVLLNNQSQLYGSVLYRARRSIAGPNEQSVGVTYEHGVNTNLNDFYEQHRDCGDVTDVNAGLCAERLTELAGDTSVAENPAQRLAASVEYRTSNGLSVDLPEYAVTFAASRAHSLVYSLAYGRNNMLGRKGRIDVTVNYEDTSVSKVTDLVPTEAITGTATAVRDRFVASATYTYKINDMMAMPLSLVYANHAAYLGDVDRKLNAHIGITLKMR